MSFAPVSSQIDFPKLERELLDWWYSSGLVNKYLHQNDASEKKFSFLDGPITANNPMGVHHAWGRTYKDLFQRYHAMKGEAERFQNGFDCQGLWVEVEVEKELGFKTKKDIEVYGVANFVNKCKERVLKYSALQTEQSKRLGYFMDWENSYFTMSDKNNYTIWGFLKECWSRGWIYKGADSVPWCPRCETAISQHEILTEDYKEIVHNSIYFKLPIVGRDNEYLLVWTTTPWTLLANIAVAVDETIEYSLAKVESGEKLWIASALVDEVLAGQPKTIEKTVLGKELVGLHYVGPFDSLPNVEAVLKAHSDKFHLVVPTDPRIMPITTVEGTGMVHTAVSAGEEDFKLGKKLGLPMIPVIADNADYIEGFGKFSGQNAKKHPEIIFDYLKEFEGGRFLFKIHPYKHRYPACWRCKTELVWKVAQEWYISMDTPDPTDALKRTYRKQMMDNTKKIHWMPDFGLERELDWLKNMHDWLISKKNRYWGLALPIYECPSCHNFEVIGSKEELKERAVSGWDKFEGNSPHKPWVDEVQIKCSQCGSTVSRIPDVGNPWLDAGIVPNSTMPASWFPADFITESFPGQFKNWFYSLIAMSTVINKENPFKNVLGYASLLAEDGRPMHKSWGNSIEFNEGADKIGADVMRWMYTAQNPQDNMLFGYKLADETRRRFHLILWNIYNFHITYANLDNFEPGDKPQDLSVLDRWILARLSQTIKTATTSLDKFDTATANHAIDEFVSDLSQWYVRRSRDRVGPAVASSSDKVAAHWTLHHVLVELCRILAPFTPFMAESMYKNLTGEESVHLSRWPASEKLGAADSQLIEDMKLLRKIVEVGLSERKTAQLKVRQPLSSLAIKSPRQLDNSELVQLLLDELNIKAAVWEKAAELSVVLDTNITPDLAEEGQVRDLIRQVQEARKSAGARLDQHIHLVAPLPKNPELLKQLQAQTLADSASEGDTVQVSLI